MVLHLKIKLYKYFDIERKCIYERIRNIAKFDESSDLFDKWNEMKEDAKAEGLIDLRYGIFAEGKGALREQENKEAEGEKSENAKLR